MQTQWKIKHPLPEVIAHLTQDLPCDQIIATLLANRGITTAKQARAFIQPALHDLRPPDGLKDLQTACERLYQAITRNENILIFGDYDVDGVTATAILYEFFNFVGANVTCYIPHRIKEGYSLQAHHISSQAISQRVDLIITADCGSASHEAIAAARQAAIDVIITDHHEIPEIPSEALAIVNPKRHDCESGFQDLAGVGVAFYLLVALRKYLREKRFWADRPEPNLKAMCDLVALGTIADMVPLQAENRIIVHHGLDMLKNGRRPGLEALIKASRLQKKSVDTDTLAFYLAPRINAAGRMDHANLALELLTTASPLAADTIARKLDRLNTERQRTEKSILDDIQAHLAENPHLLERKALVLAEPDWHAGILGIVASRVAKQYHRPAVLIAIDGDMGQGSGRSIPGLNLYSALDSCQQELIGFGGHAMAAGLRVQTNHIPAFQEAFEATIQVLSADTDLSPVLTIDYELAFEDINAGLIDAIESLQPFGVAIPKPLFMASDIRVRSSKIVGSNHRRMSLSQASAPRNVRFDAIQFNIDQEKVLPDHFERIAFELQWNRWNGNRKPQLLINAFDAET